MPAGRAASANPADEPAKLKLERVAFVPAHLLSRTAFDFCYLILLVSAPGLEPRTGSLDRAMSQEHGWRGDYFTDMEQDDSDADPEEAKQQAPEMCPCA
ncbi:hypothetical protein [Bradyrhizobium yuanmingense]|uniref:Uncharacterized protein n=1 Tax=Bradyrhizobium yuanmingense TaxID=108015 RepID=A0ABV4GSM1_9BRAD|nr:hypothetical protein [Bradyrhizobium yuanmingense]